MRLKAAAIAISYKLLASATCGPERDDQGIFGDAPLRHILSLHLSDGRPYQLEDRLVNLAAIPEAWDANFSSVSPNEWLIAQIPYSSVRTILRAELASAEDARFLKRKTGEPVFVIERQTQLNGVALTQVRMAHPGNRFQMITATDDLR